MEGGGVRFCFFGGALPPPRVTNNVIVGNFTEGQGSGLVCFDAQIVCENLTIAGNSSGAGGGGAVAALVGSLELRNCIIAENMGSGIYRDDCELVTDYCDVWRNLGGNYANCQPAETDISCDPEFCDQEDGDYRLFETSCCQGAGRDGVDIGAYGVGCFTVPDVVFFDNFSDQNDVGWNVTTSGDASLIVDAGSYYGTASEPGDWARSVVEWEGEPLENYSYWIKVRLMDIAQAQETLDVFLRYRDADQYYIVRLDGSTGRLYKRLDGDLDLLQEFEAPIEIDTWTTLNFTALDYELTGRILEGDPHGELFEVYDETTPILSGTVGVGVSSGGNLWQTRFDDAMVATIDSTLTAIPVTEEPEASTAPAKFNLRTFPNPFNPSVAIEFELLSPREVEIALYTIDGRRIATLGSELRPAGRHRVVWNGRCGSGLPISSGTYLCRMTADGQSETRKIVLIR